MSQNNLQVAGATVEKLNDLVQLFGDEEFFQQETPERGHSKERSSYTVRLRQVDDEAYLDFSCDGSWYERTTSAVMLGNRAIRHDITRRFILRKVGEEWYLDHGRQSMRHEYAPLSSRDLGLDELSTYAERIADVIRYYHSQEA